MNWSLNDFAFLHDIFALITILIAAQLSRFEGLLTRTTLKKNIHQGTKPCEEVPAAITAYAQWWLKLMWED